jgi:hypothetical protein
MLAVEEPQPLAALQAITLPHSAEQLNTLLLQPSQLVELLASVPVLLHATEPTAASKQRGIKVSAPATKALKDAKAPLPVLLVDILSGNTVWYLDRPINSNTAMKSTAMTMITHLQR